MGAVYRAFDPSLNRKVALKIMALKGAEAVERFRREERLILIKTSRIRLSPIAPRQSN